MAQPLPMPPPGFGDLEPDQKLHYLTALWDRIANSEEVLPVTDSQRVFLRDRMAAHEANPASAKPWGDVRREIEAELDEGPRTSYYSLRHCLGFLSFLA